MPEVPVYTAAQVQAAEEPLLAAGEPLMLRASAALARIVREETAGEESRVLVLAGGGTNGGDALFAAAELAAAGIAVELALVGRTAPGSSTRRRLRTGATTSWWTVCWASGRRGRRCCESLRESSWPHCGPACMRGSPA